MYARKLEHQISVKLQHKKKRKLHSNVNSVKVKDIIRSHIERFYIKFNNIFNLTPSHVKLYYMTNKIIMLYCII